MKTLNKGDKPTDEIIKTVIEAGEKIAKSYTAGASAAKPAAEKTDKATKPKKAKA